MQSSTRNEKGQSIRIGIKPRRVRLIKSIRHHR